MKIRNDLVFILLILSAFCGTSQAAISIDKVYPIKMTLTQGESFQLVIGGQSLKDISRALLLLKAKGKQKLIRLPLKVTGNDSRAQLDLKISQPLSPGNYVLYLLDSNNKKVKVPVAISLVKNPLVNQAATSANKPSSRVSKPSRAKSKRSSREKTSRTQVRQKRQISQAKGTKQTSIGNSGKQRKAKQSYQTKLGNVTNPVAVRNNVNSSQAVTIDINAADLLANRPSQPNSLTQVDAPRVQRVSIQTVTINDGMEDTDDRLIRIQIAVANGPIQGYRICDTNEGPARANCDATQKPWQAYHGNEISYLLESDNMATYNSGNKPRKRLMIQVKGNPIASSQINNVQVDNFSTIKTAYISYQGQPSLDSFPATVPQYRLSSYEFNVSNLRAHHVTGEVRPYSNNCKFGVDNPAPIYQGEKLTDKSFKFRIFTIGASTNQSLSCNASLFIKAYDENRQEIENFRLTYEQQFLPYEPRYITLQNTAPLMEKLSIEKQDVFFGPEQGLTICEGFSIGTSGRKPIGVLTESGDLVFATRSTNLGRTCIYSIKARIHNGWMLTMNFDQIKDGKNCEISQTGQPKHLAPVKFAFNRERRFIGWEKVVNLFNGSRQSGNWRMEARPSYKVPTVFMTCKPSLSNNHGVKSVLKSVVFEVPPNAPDDATWQDAFYQPE